MAQQVQPADADQQDLLEMWVPLAIQEILEIQVILVALEIQARQEIRVFLERR